MLLCAGGFLLVWYLSSNCYVLVASTDCGIAAGFAPPETRKTRLYLGYIRHTLPAGGRYSVRARAYELFFLVLASTRPRCCYVVASNLSISLSRSPSHPLSRFLALSPQEADDRRHVNGGGRSPVPLRGRSGGGGSGRVSAELTSLAAGHLVSLLKEPEVAQELWPLITKCVDNVVAGRSVPSSLELLRRAIATLPAHEAKSWFGGSRTKENRYKKSWRS